jgi:hypothetical protein
MPLTFVKGTLDLADKPFRLTATSAVLLLALVGHAAAAPVPLAPDQGNVNKTINFGDDRGKKTIRFSFTAMPPENTALTQPPGAYISDLQTSDGTQFNGTVRATPTLGDDKRSIIVTVNVDPAKTRAGDYSGDLLLRGPEVTDARAQLTTKLHALPWPGGKEAYAWLLALGLLLGGALMGWFAQWLAGPGTRLRDLVNRFEIVSSLARPLTPVPPAFETAVLQAGTQLAHRQLDAAETSITALEEKTPVVLRVSALAKALAALLAGQLETIRRISGLTAPERAELEQVVAQEDAVRADLLDDGWPEPTTALTTAKEKLPHLRNASSFLVLFSDPVNRAKPEFQDALRLYLDQDYGAAEAKWKSVSGTQAQNAAAAEAVPAVVVGEMEEAGAFEPPTTPARVGGGAGFSPSLWAARHAPLFAGLMIVLGFGVAGLATIFDAGETFRTHAGSDAVKLFVWGLAAGLTGVTVNQLSGRLTPSTGTH